MAPPLRVAVIGAGWAAELHLQAYAATDDTDVVAICSRTRSKTEEVAARFGVPQVYTDFDEMLRAEELDVVSIATPPDAHREFTLGAAEAGCHVLCDKPVALTAQEAEELLNGVESRGVRHATGFIWRNDPALRRLRALIGEGSIGEIRELHCRCAIGAPVLPMTWMYDAAAGGGSLMQHGQHIVDRARWLLGSEIVGVSGELTYDVKETVQGPKFHNVFDAFGWAAERARGGGGGDDLPTVEVTADTGYSFAASFENGVRAQFWEAMHSSGLSPDQIEVFGSQGTLVWSATSGLVRLQGRRPPETIEVEGTSASGAGDLRGAEEAGHRYWRELAQAFAADIRGAEHDDYPTLYDGWKVQQVVDAVRASTESRSWEGIPSGARVS
jgi:predicted dehydrogenase